VSQSHFNDICRLVGRTPPAHRLSDEEILERLLALNLQGAEAREAN
jgi:hypothetical protein